MTTTERSNEEMIAEYRQTGDRALYNYFFEANINLGRTVVKKYLVNHPHDKDELLSIACIGMIKAFDAFKMDKGYKFSTFAGLCMDNEIKMHLRKERNRKKANFISLDMKIAESDGGADALLQDIIPDTWASEATARVDGAETVKVLMEHLEDFLSERELYILKNHLRENPVNFRTLGEELGSARSSVHKTAQRAYRKAKIIVEKLDIADEAHRTNNHKAKRAFSRDEERYRVCRGVYVYYRQNEPNLLPHEIARKLGVSRAYVHTLGTKYKAGELKDEPLHPSELNNIVVPVKQEVLPGDINEPVR